MYAMAVGIVADERIPESERAMNSMVKLCARPIKKRQMA